MYLHKGLRARAVILLVLVVGMCGVSFFAYAHGTRQDGMLRVVFFDVGQGDAIFIETPSGVQILIDGGPDTAVLRGLSKEMGFFDKTIDYMIATHPDADHIGGLNDVLRRYDVKTIITTDNVSDTSVADLFEKNIEAEHARLLDAQDIRAIQLEVGIVLRVLFPDRDVANTESNLSSIVAQLVYGESEFLFTGDSPIAIEEYLVERDGSTLASDVLKAGHHGSRTSSSEIFVDTVHPTYAVISAGKDNRYGHPHQEVIDMLTEDGVEILSTTEQGSIMFETDGKTVEALGMDI